MCLLSSRFYLFSLATVQIALATAIIDNKYVDASLSARLHVNIAINLI